MNGKKGEVELRGGREVNAAAAMLGLYSWRAPRCHSDAFPDFA
jgi:hypothetical protein